MPKMPEAGRILSLLRFAEMNSGWLKIAEAAQVLGVDVDELPELACRLCDLGAPPFEPQDMFDVELRGDWLHVHPPAGYTDFVHLSVADVALLQACLAVLAPGLDDVGRARCAALEQRLADSLGETRRIEAASWSGSVTWAVSAGLSPEVVKVLHAGMSQRCEVVLKYYNHSRDSIDERVVKPWRIVEHNGRWYLSGEDAVRGGDRHWRLDRMVSAALTDTPFGGVGPAAAHYRRDVLFDEASQGVTVRVRFDAAVAERRVRWFGDDVVSEDADSVVMELHGATLPVLLRRLIAFGEGWALEGPDEAVQLLRRWCEPVRG